MIDTKCWTFPKNVRQKTNFKNFRQKISLIIFDKKCSAKTLEKYLTKIFDKKQFDKNWSTKNVPLKICR